MVHLGSHPHLQQHNVVLVLLQLQGTGLCQQGVVRVVSSKF